MTENKKVIALRRFQNCILHIWVPPFLICFLFPLQERSFRIRRSLDQFKCKFRESIHCRIYLYYIHRIYPKYSDTFTTSYPSKIWKSSFYYLSICLNYCWMSGKQRRPWSDAAFCGVWSWSTLFAQAYQPQYSGLLRYTKYLDWIASNHTYPKFWTSPFEYLLRCLINN